jgi:hypothetical protein
VLRARSPPRDASFEIPIEEEAVDLAELAKTIDERTR